MATLVVGVLLLGGTAMAANLGILPTVSSRQGYRLDVVHRQPVVVSLPTVPGSGAGTDDMDASPAGPRIDVDEADQAGTEGEADDDGTRGEADDGSSGAESESSADHHESSDRDARSHGGDEVTPTTAEPVEDGNDHGGGSTISDPRGSIDGEQHGDGDRRGHRSGGSGPNRAERSDDGRFDDD